MTKQQISDYFVELLNNLTIKTSPDYPDSIFYLYKDKPYIEYDQKNSHAWLDINRIWSVFESKYLDNYDEIQKITQALLEEHLKLKGITTDLSDYMSDVVEEHLKLRGVTTQTKIINN